MRKWLPVLLLVILCGAAACTLGDRKRRAFLPPHKYTQVREIYQRTQSIDLVRRTLEDNHWYPAEINEALYRLRHELAVIETRDPLQL